MDRVTAVIATATGSDPKTVKASIKSHILGGLRNEEARRQGEADFHPNDGADAPPGSNGTTNYRHWGKNQTNARYMAIRGTRIVLEQALAHNEGVATTIQPTTRAAADEIDIGNQTAPIFLKTYGALQSHGVSSQVAFEVAKGVAIAWGASRLTIAP